MGAEGLNVDLIKNQELMNGRDLWEFAKDVLRQVPIQECLFLLLIIIK